MPHSGSDVARHVQIDATTSLKVVPRNKPLVEILPVAHCLVGAVDRGEPLQRALEDYLANEPALVPYFERANDGLAPSHFLGKHILYPEDNPLDFVATKPLADEESEQLIVELTSDTAASIGDVLRLVGSGDHTECEIRESLDELGVELFDNMLLSKQIVYSAGGQPKRDFSAPGLYRLQHASLLFRSRRQGVLVDPHLHVGNSGTVGDFTRAELEGNVDAILISHSHEDHFNLATLLQFRRDLPIIVPQVPRNTLICTAMGELLRELGFTDVREPAWFGPPMRFGDIEVQALPFYGEQPLVSEELSDPSMRNWGSTFLVRTPEYSAWILVDSGQDAMGDAGELAAEVYRRYGSVDFVLSNLRTFYVHPFQIGGKGEHWWPLSLEQMANYGRHRGDLTTVGPVGVARVCENVRARWFLPYAHWWCSPGVPVGEEVHTESGETEALCDEAEMLEGLRVELVKRGVPTTIEGWTVGSRVNLLEDGPVFQRPDPARG